MRPDVPIFDLTDSFQTTVRIGGVKDERTGLFDGGHLLPITIKRYSRAELEAFEKKWNAFFVEPRGTAESTPEEKAKREEDLLRFTEEAIRFAITLEPGYVRDRGKDVVDGQGLLDVFYSRKDVLSALLVPIYTENKLSGVLSKNSKSPRDSGTGSAPTGESRSGDSQEPAARAAGRSSSAPNGAATASPAASETAAAGVSGEQTKVH